MKRYHQFTVNLDSGAEFTIRVNGMYIDQFNAWIKHVPGIASYEEVRSAYRISPFTHENTRRTKITAARLAAGLTQQELGDKIGVNYQQVQRWENGTYRPRTPTLKRIGEALGVDWTTLIEDEEQAP